MFGGDVEVGEVRGEFGEELGDVLAKHEVVG